MEKYALISVSDKTGIVELAKGITEKGYKILATGNTAKQLKENGVEVINISDFTGFPEVFSGRVKTLQPQIFGGILFRRENKEDLNEAAQNNIEQIDIVCVNLYPFPQVVNKTDISIDEKIENIDIGGPSLIRAAAKNHFYVSVLTNPSQYKGFLQELNAGDITFGTRQKLAADAFAHTADYDRVIADYFEREFETNSKSLRVSLPLEFSLRYGENPHQSAKLYGNFEEYFEKLHGKELSYNNLVDLTGAIELVDEFDSCGCAIIKHTNPCGAALADTPYDAYVNALSCDPVSSFGGIVVFNRTVDLKTAEKLNEIFLEIIAAPDFEPAAFELLQKKKNRRLLKILKSVSGSKVPMVRPVPGGYLLQDKDSSKLSELELKLVTKNEYTQEQFENLKFAWLVCKHVKSNAIVYVKDFKAVGVGAGQMSRIDSAKIAAMKAKQFGHELSGAVAASDAYFPFADGLETIVENGITAVIQPGGSVRDEEVIEAAEKNNISMVFTGVRNFKH